MEDEYQIVTVTLWDQALAYYQTAVDDNVDPREIAINMRLMSKMVDYLVDHDGKMPENG